MAARASALRCCWDDSEIEETLAVCCSAVGNDDGTDNGLRGGDAVSLFATR